jgi:imidazolonepropionase-like amidohydrolase
MRLRSSGLWAVAAATLAIGLGAQTSDAILISDVTVVDVVAGASRPHRTIVVRNGRIETVTPGLPPKPPAGARVLDGAGKYVIPGLWDMHVHLNGDGAVLGRLLAAGLTGVREMGDSFAPLAEARRYIDSGQWDGPRLVLSGPMLRGPQSPRDTSGGGSRIVRTPEEARQAIAELDALGVDFIKIQDYLSRDTFFAISEAARARNKKFAGHVPADVTPVEASDAGEYSIEHFDWLPKPCAALFKQEEEAVRAMPAELCDASAVDAILQRLVRNGTWLCPTIAQFQYLSPGHWKAILAGFQRQVPALRRSGVRLLAGTDWQRSLEARGGPPGTTLHEELEALVEAGFTPAEALRTATVNPAEFFGMSAELGSVEPGRIADLVVLSADPLADIRNTSSIEAVIHDGRVIKR